MAAAAPCALLRLLLALALAQVAPSLAQIQCNSKNECPQQGPSWTSLWYVWVILLTVFLLLLCGIGASCVKFCCRKKRPPQQSFPPHAHDLTIIPMDHDSTAHSTVTSYSSLQYPQNLLLPVSFREADRNLGSPPAYSLYAIEMPPSYEEAIRMAKPPAEAPCVGQKLGGAPSEPAAPMEANPPPILPESSESGVEALPEGSAAPEASTEEQP